MRFLCGYFLLENILRKGWLLFGIPGVPHLVQEEAAHVDDEWDHKPPVEEQNPTGRQDTHSVQTGETARRRPRREDLAGVPDGRKAAQRPDGRAALRVDGSDLQVETGGLVQRGGHHQETQNAEHHSAFGRLG